MGDLYGDLFDGRQEGDYGDIVSFQLDEVQTWLDEARLFVDRIAEEIAKASG